MSYRRLLATAAALAALTGLTTAPVASAHYWTPATPSSTAVTAAKIAGHSLRAYGTGKPAKAFAYLPDIRLALHDSRIAALVDQGSLTDRNRDRYDDDGRITFRYAHIAACLDVYTGKVTDRACNTRPRPDFTPLQTAARTLDAEVRLETAHSGLRRPLWDHAALDYIRTHDVAKGVKVVITDRNNDGVEDDGRVEIAKNGNRLCLVLPRSERGKATVLFRACPTSPRR